MSNYQHELTDEQLERLLEKSAAAMDQPPAEVVKDVTPWGRAMERIITGTALNMLTLHFLGLQYILPTVGLTLLLLGFRALRRENRWFRMAYVMSLYRWAYLILTLILNATIYTLPHTVSDLLSYTQLGCQFLVYVCLWQGLLAVQRKAGVEVSAPGAGGIILWNTVMIVLALMQAGGWFLLLALLGVYIALLCSLSETSKTLDQAGYDITTAPVRIQDDLLTYGTVVLIVAGILLGYLFGSKYAMDWQVREETIPEEVAAIKADLLALGYPDYALDDLSAEDILACQGAKRVLPAFHYPSGNEMSGVMEQAYVLVELAEENQWRYFCHFHWKEDRNKVKPEFHGTEAIKISPVYSQIHYWSPAGNITGQVLYTDGDNTYTAPYHVLEEKSFTQQGFFGTTNQTTIFATFSLPFRYQAQRGYVAYTAILSPNEEFNVASTSYDYIHQNTAFFYPAQAASDASAWSIRKEFVFLSQYFQLTLYENGAVEYW